MSEVTAAATVKVRITPELISRFAALTGDRSSLHVNEAFARRSAYRRPVAHGMLPVACLSLSAPFNEVGVACVLREIDGRFAAPVFAGDVLLVAVNATSASDESGRAAFAYDIRNAATGATATRGTFAVTYEPRTGPAVPGSGSGPMVAEAIDVRHVRFENIEVGARDDIDFIVSGATLRDFASLVGAAADAEVPEGFPAGCHVPNLAALLLLSTSVGVQLPGASATFLEFSVRFDRRVELDTPYHLAATVTRRSVATRIVKKEIAIAPRSGETGAAAHGKVSSLVAKPFATMPSSDELKGATSWGLEGKTILVTGASRGIGETTAKLLALLGARVVVNYHRGADDARRVVEEIAAHGGEAVAIAADVSDADQVRAMVEEARRRFGPIHVLVNNAARDFRPIPFLQLSWDEVQRDLDVIAKGAFLCCQAVLPLMLEGGGGKIVNISTVATDDPPPDQAKYVMAKSALVGLTRSLSIEFAARNIQVNLVVPNFVETDFVAHIQDGFRKKMAQETPMRRHASPIDVARAVAFLASDHSSFTTGQKLMVTGGGAPYA